MENGMWCCGVEGGRAVRITASEMGKRMAARNVANLKNLGHESKAAREDQPVV